MVQQARERVKMGTEALNDATAQEVFNWLIGERAYQLNKFGIAQDDLHTAEGINMNDSWWWNQMVMYIHRSAILGLETPNGRQALAKFVATACGMLESVVRTHGPLPTPAQSSGNIE
jgi:hypothetical protein